MKKKMDSRESGNDGLSCFSLLWALDTGMRRNEMHYLFGRFVHLDSGVRRNDGKESVLPKGGERLWIA